MKGSELKDWRERKGVSQQDLADKLGVSRQTIVRQEALPELSDKIEARIRKLRVENGISTIQDILEEIITLTNREE